MVDAEPSQTDGHGFLPGLQAAADPVDHHERGVVDEESVPQPDGAVQGPDDEGKSGNVTDCPVGDDLAADLDPLRIKILTVKV